MHICPACAERSYRAAGRGHQHGTAVHARKEGEHQKEEEERMLGEAEEANVKGKEGERVLRDVY